MGKEILEYIKVGSLVVIAISLVVIASKMGDVVNYLYDIALK